MPRCNGRAHTLALGSGNFQEADLPSPEIVQFWESLPVSRRGKLLSVERKTIFAKIRELYCSRCFGLFVLRYEEMKGAAALDCPACQEFYAGLGVSDSGEIAVDQGILETEPFTIFAEGKLREREREMQFMTGDICGSGYQKRPGNNMCALHSSPVPVEALLEYFRELPEEHKGALLTLREEDFAAELDAHLKYQLRICRDCRSNVMRAYRDLKPAAKGQPAELLTLELCPNFNLRVAERLVTVEGEGVTEFFNRAEDVEGCKTVDQEDAIYDDLDNVRHAETPELAREALIDSAVLIYKSQIEVAFREQTAGHNALLLFVGLALQLMEEQLYNAFKELGAKEAEAELLDLVAKEKERKEATRQKKQRSKKGGKAADAKEDVENAGSGAPPQPRRRQCQQCSVLQQCSRCSLARKASPVRAVPISPLKPPAGGGASVLTVPRAVPVSCEEPVRTGGDEEAGGWEVQQPKRRGAVQQPGPKKAVIGSQGGSSSGSASPERLRRTSLDQPQLQQPGPRPRSPFARRTVQLVHPPEPPKRPRDAGPRPLAVPVQAFSCTVAVPPPPPPPPPREPRPSSRVAGEPSTRPTAWQKPGAEPTGLATQVTDNSAPSSAHEWTPWSGRSPALSSQLEQLQLGQGCAAVGGPVRIGIARTAVAVNVLEDSRREEAFVHDAFSLFHFSPVPKETVQLAQKDRDASAPGYQLFGTAHSGYPLAPLAPVLSL